MEPRSVGATLTAAVTATTGDILTKQAFSVSLNVFSVKAAIISPFNHPLTHRGDTKLDSFHSPSGGGGGVLQPAGEPRCKQHSNH